MTLLSLDQNNILLYSVQSNLGKSGKPTDWQCLPAIIRYCAIAIHANVLVLGYETKKKSGYQKFEHTYRAIIGRTEYHIMKLEFEILEFVELRFVYKIQLACQLISCSNPM